MSEDKIFWIKERELDAPYKGNSYGIFISHDDFPGAAPYAPQGQITTLQARVDELEACLEYERLEAGSAHAENRVERITEALEGSTK